MQKSNFHFLSPQGTPADVLYKGTITRLITEDSASRAEREREDVLPKGHVLYEGISGHILTYDREFITLDVSYSVSSVWFLLDFAITILYVELLIHIKCQRYHPYPKNYCLCTHKVTSLLFVGPGSQSSKDEGRGPGQSGEILGLKRPYDVMEGGISRGLPMRESLSAANCEGKIGLSVTYHV